MSFTRVDDLASGVVMFGLPVVDLALLTVTDLSKRPDLALLWLPVTFALGGAMVCVLARLGVGRSLVVVLGCIWWCMLAGLALVVIDIMIFPF